MNSEAFYKLTYGLYIISTKWEGKSNGYVGNTAFQVTADPSQIAVSCHKDNYSTALIEKSKRFTLSVLQQEASAELIGLFGYQRGDAVDKFKEVQHQETPDGIPYVTQDSIAWFDCKVVNQFDVGSHILFIGEILNNEVLNASAEPLTYDYYRNVKKGFAPKNAPTYQEKKEENHSEVKETVDENWKKWKCLICAYFYDEGTGDAPAGIPPGTKFEDLPDDWTCPICGAGTDMFDEG